MKIFIFFILLFQIIFSIRFPYELYSSPLIHQILKNRNISNPNDPEMVGKLITNIIMAILKRIIIIGNNTISSDCISFIEDLDDSKSYSDNYKDDIKIKQYKSREMAIKLLLDSSKGRNELNNCKNCLDKNLTHLDYNQTVNEYTYFIALISTADLKNNNNINLENIKKYEDHSYLLGYCVPWSNKCSEDDYIKIIRLLNEYYNYIFYPENSDINTHFIIDSNEVKFENEVLSIIFLVILGILIGLVLFQYPIYYLIKKSYKNDKITNNEKNKEE